MSITVAQIHASSHRDPYRYILYGGCRLYFLAAITMCGSDAVVSSVSHLEDSCVELLPAVEFNGYSR
jgi:hypothetical protein